MFKKGDRVRCLETYGSQFTKDKIYTVAEAKADFVYVDSDDRGFQYNAWHYSKFEKDELDTLIHKANEGLAAISKLLHSNEIQCKAYGNPVSLESLYHRSRGSDFSAFFDKALKIERKAVPKFEPFTLSNGWKVELDGVYMNIGCRKFTVESVYEVLRDLVVNNLSYSNNLNPYYKDIPRVCRAGIILGSDTLQWKDAEELFERLKAYLDKK